MGELFFTQFSVISAKEDGWVSVPFKVYSTSITGHPQMILAPLTSLKVTNQETTLLQKDKIEETVP